MDLGFAGPSARAEPPDPSVTLALDLIGACACTVPRRLKPRRWPEVGSIGG